MCVSQGDKKYVKKTGYTGRGYSGVKRGIYFYPSETSDSRKVSREQKRTAQKKTQKKLQFYVSNLLLLKYDRIPPDFTDRENRTRYKREVVTSRWKCLLQKFGL